MPNTCVWVWVWLVCDCFDWMNEWMKNWNRYRSNLLNFPFRSAGSDARVYIPHLMAFDKTLFSLDSILSGAMHKMMRNVAGQTIDKGFTLPRQPNAINRDNVFIPLIAMIYFFEYTWFGRVAEFHSNNSRFSTLLIYASFANVVQFGYSEKRKEKERERNHIQNETNRRY